MAWYNVISCPLFEKRSVVRLILRMALINEYLLACVVLVGAAYLWNRWLKQRKDLLPGPSFFQILANFGELGAHPYRLHQKWAKTYGPIFRMKMGGTEMIVVNDYKLIKELFNEKATAGRALNNPAIFEISKGNYGVMNSSGAVWEQQRRFTLRTLRDFGFAKTSMESMILDEAQAMVKYFRSLGENKSIPVVRTFNAPVVNSLWRIVSGQRCAWEESRPPILDLADNHFKNFSKVATSGIFFIPSVRHLAPEKSGWNSFCQGIKDLVTYYEQAVKEHKQSFDDTDKRDFIDYFLSEMKRATDGSSSFHGEQGEQNLIANIFDLFTAGNETMSATLSWTLKYCLKYPQVQKKLHQEIDKVIGGSRLPSLADRAQMPYTEAVLHEILRKSAVAPLGVPHCLTEDLMFEGYHLPKGSQLLSNLYAVHHDPQIWGDPEIFRPERFLTADGSQFQKNEHLIPFGDGRRKCPGETMAKDTIFLFVTRLLQEFQIEKESPETQVDMEPEPGIFDVPTQFNMKLRYRKLIE